MLPRRLYRVSAVIVGVLYKNFFYQKHLQCKSILIWQNVEIPNYCCCFFIRNRRWITVEECFLWMLYPFFYRNGSVSCPIDNEPITPKQHFNDRAREKEILNLECFCTNRARGCQWTGTILDLQVSECWCYIVGGKQGKIWVHRNNFLVDNDVVATFAEVPVSFDHQTFWGSRRCF